MGTRLCPYDTKTSPPSISRQPDHAQTDQDKAARLGDGGCIEEDIIENVPGPLLSWFPVRIDKGVASRVSTFIDARNKSPWKPHCPPKS
jgi:hypothetical protein